MMIFTRFIAIALILILMEPVGDYASRFILPKEVRERKSNPDDIVYDEKTRTESIRNPFEPPQCPRKSSTHRNLLVDAAVTRMFDFSEAAIREQRHKREKETEMVREITQAEAAASREEDHGRVEAKAVQMEDTRVQYDKDIREIEGDDEALIKYLMAYAARTGHEPVEGDISSWLVEHVRESEEEDKKLLVYAPWIYENHISVIPNDDGCGPIRPVIVIGDPHGSYAELLSIFQGLHLVDSGETWVGTNTIVVIMGDLIHRGTDSALCVYRIFKEWQPQAPIFGSNIIVLFGNHELQQFWFGFHHIEFGGYKGALYMKKGDQEALQTEEYLEIIRRNSFVVVKVGSDFFTHSGFELSQLRKFFSHHGTPVPADANVCILSLNEISRDMLTEYSNRRLEQIVSGLAGERSKVYERLKSQKGKETPYLSQAIVKALQIEPSAQSQKDINGIECVNALRSMMNSHIAKEIPSNEKIESTLYEFSRPLLSHFDANRLWVGHFYNQMETGFRSDKELSIPTAIGGMVFTDHGMFERGVRDGPIFFVIETDGGAQMFHVSTSISDIDGKKSISLDASDNWSMIPVYSKH